MYKCACTPKFSETVNCGGRRKRMSERQTADHRLNNTVPTPYSILHVLYVHYIVYYIIILYKK